MPRNYKVQSKSCHENRVERKISTDFCTQVKEMTVVGIRPSAQIHGDLNSCNAL